MQSEAQRPTCSSANEGQLVYVRDTKALQFCSAGEWQTATLGGGQGIAGGASSRIEATIHCGGNLPSTNIWVDYSVALMTSGDLFVTGSVRDSALQVSATAFYGAQQNGAATGSLLIEFDQAGSSNAGYWQLSLDRTTLVHSVVYKDADLSSNQSWTMTPDKCVKTTAS